MVKTPAPAKAILRTAFALAGRPLAEGSAAEKPEVVGKMRTLVDSFEASLAAEGTFSD